jgi:RNA polymerase sigma factor for flagellar operon FliA
MPTVPLNSEATDPERGGSTFAERLPDQNAVPPDAVLERREQRELIRDAIATLPEQQRVVLALCYNEGLNLRQIAEVLHVTESRVSQVRTAAIRTLRHRVALELAP